MRTLIFLLFFSFTVFGQLKIGKTAGANQSQDAHGATYIVKMSNIDTITVRSVVDSVFSVPRAGYADHWKLVFTATRSGGSWTIVDTLWINENNAAGSIRQEQSFDLGEPFYVNPGEWIGWYVPLLTGDVYGKNGFRTRRDLSNTVAGEDSVFAYTGTLGPEVGIIGRTITPADSSAYASFEDFYLFEMFLTADPEISESPSVSTKQLQYNHNHGYKDYLRED